MDVIVSYNTVLKSRDKRFIVSNLQNDPCEECRGVTLTAMVFITPLSTIFQL
jgi:hypothetical protein